MVVAIQQLKTRPRDQKIWWLYERKPLLVYLHSAEIDSHRHCINGYIINLVCHVILQDHIIIWTFDFISESYSRLLIILPRFVAISIVVVKIQCF